MKTQVCRQLAFFLLLNFALSACKTTEEKPDKTMDSPSDCHQLASCVDFEMYCKKGEKTPPLLGAKFNGYPFAEIAVEDYLLILAQRLDRFLKDPNNDITGFYAILPMHSFAKPLPGRNESKQHEAHFEKTLKGKLAGLNVYCPQRDPGEPRKATLVQPNVPKTFDRIDLMNAKDGEIVLEGVPERVKRFNLIGVQTLDNMEVTFFHFELTNTGKSASSGDVYRYLRKDAEENIFGEEYRVMLDGQVVIKPGLEQIETVKRTEKYSIHDPNWDDSCRMCFDMADSKVLRETGYCPDDGLSIYRFQVGPFTREELSDLLTKRTKVYFYVVDAALQRLGVAGVGYRKVLESHPDGDRMVAQYQQCVENIRFNGGFGEYRGDGFEVEKEDGIYLWYCMSPHTVRTFLAHPINGSNCIFQ